MYTRTDINQMRERITIAFEEVVNRYESEGAINAMIPLREVFWQTATHNYGLFRIALSEQLAEGMYHRVWVKSLIDDHYIKSYLV